MKDIRAPLNLLITLILLLIVLACSLGSGQPSKPTVAIASPKTGSSFTLNQEVIVQSVAADPKGITRVELWVDGQAVYIEAVAPPATSYAANQPWTPTIPGSHVIEVRAYNADNTPTDSAQIIVTVTKAVDEAASAAANTPADSATASSSLIPTTLPTSIPAKIPDTAIPSPTVPPPTPPPTPVPTVPPTPFPTPQIKFWLDYPTLTCSQQSTGLHWSVADGTEVFLSVDDPQGGHLVSPQGEEEVAPTANTRYYLTAKGPGGVNQVYNDVTVQPPTSPLPPSWATGPDHTYVGQTPACEYARINLLTDFCGGHAVFSPDGSEVAVMALDRLYVINTAGTQVRELIVPPGYSPGGDIVWSPQAEYIAYVYNDNGTLKVGVTRRDGTASSDLWVINPEGITDWPRWTTDQRLLVTSGPVQPIENVYAVSLSGPSVEIRPVTRCETYELSTNVERQQYYPWGPGRVWVGGSTAIYPSDY